MPHAMVLWLFISKNYKYARKDMNYSHFGTDVTWETIKKE